MWNCVRKGITHNSSPIILYFAYKLNTDSLVKAEMFQIYRVIFVYPNINLTITCRLISFSALLITISITSLYNIGYLPPFNKIASLYTLGYLPLTKLPPLTSMITCL